MDQITLLEKRLAREKKARETAEKLLEKKALELYLANQELQRLNTNLQQEVSNKTGELELQSTRLSIILKNLQEGILLEDSQRKITLVNQTFCNIFNLPVSPEALIGLDCPTAMEESKNFFEQPDLFVGIVNQMLQEQSYSPPAFLKTKTGRILELSYNPIKNKDELIGHLWRYQDKTEQILADTKIRQSEEKYRSIMENMDLGLMEVNTSGIITKVYDRFCQMMGYKESEELLGKIAKDVFLPLEFQELMAQQDEIRKEGKASSYEIQMLTKQGERKWVLIGGAPFFNTDGNLEGTIGIHYDITYQKELQKELEIARHDAEAARDAEKEFLANMSHEIRNPINSIIGMTNLLYDTNPQKDQLEYLNHIQYSSELLLALISDILDISKISEGKMEMNTSVFDAKDLFCTIGKTIEFRLQEKPVSFQLDLSPDLPEQLIGDRTFLNQILFNLLGNAIKFTPSGTISLAIQPQKQTDDEVWLAFSVRDSGIGIPLDKQSHIFERFGQAGKAKEVSGTGLGLPITKELIQLMGGTISLESQPGAGAGFFFELPFKIPTGTKKQQQKVDKAELFSNSLGLQILIVEDNESNRIYLEKLLEKWKIQYTSCSNGAEALQILETKSFDLALMDIRMPVLDGYETTVRLRASSSHPNQEIPIIALTASALLDEKEKALAAGMNYHLTKPFTPDRLAEAILHFVQNPSVSFSQDDNFTWPSPFSEPTIKDLYAGDLAYTKVMFELFLKNISGELQEVSASIQENKLLETADLLHKIKPNFTMVGLPQIGIKITELEDKCKSDQTDIIDQEWSDLQKEITSLIPQIEHITNQLKERT